MTSRILTRIDLAALKHNCRRGRDYAPQSRVMAVVKANAYGHGDAGLPVETVAEHAGTIACETLCTVNARVPRIEVDGG